MLATSSAAGEALRSVRAAKGIKQQEVADALGITTATVSHWENGKTEPLMSQAVSLSRLYGVSMDVLCGLKPLVG